MAITNTAIPGSPYRVPPEPSRNSSMLLAALVHAGLLGFLWAGISWQNNPPLTQEAEVWDMKLQTAAAPPEPAQPPPPRPEPVAPVKPPAPPPRVEEPVAPKPPDIALEREKKQKELKQKQLAEEKLQEQKRLEQKKLADDKRELEKARKELAEQKKRDAEEQADKLAKEKADKLAKSKAAAAEQAKLDKLRDAEMKRILGAAGTGGEAAKSTAPRGDPSYYGAIGAKIKSNLNYAGSTDVPGDPEAIFQIEQLPTGEIISVRKTKSSGVPAYDQAVENAINKSSPLPKKKDGTVQRSVPAAFRLKESAN